MSTHRTPWLLAVLLTLGLCHTSLTSFAEDRCGALAGVERWQGEFTVTASEDVESPHAAGTMGALYRKYRWNASGSIDLRPEFQDSERLRASWSAQEQGFGATMNDVDGQRSGDPPIDLQVIMEARTLERDVSSARLTLNCERGEYRLAVHAGQFLVKRRMQLPPAIAQVCKAAAGNQDNALPAAMVCAIYKSAQEKFEREPMHFSVRATTDDADGKSPTFDAKTQVLTGKRRVKLNESMMNGKELEGELTWTLRPGKPSPYEAIIVPSKTFAQWIPEANTTTPAAAGSAVAVTVELRRKDKPKEPAEEKARFEFELLDVSHAPGWCTNFPVKGDTEADLRIEPKMNTGLNVPEPHRATTKENALAATVWLSSFDMGAHARLRVTVTTASGQRFFAHLDGKPGTTELAVPQDDDNNQVADYWQEKNGVPTGRPVTWDEDPPLQKRLGDGYTLFEEYRGFMTTSGYIRTLPSKKDLFVYDPDGLVKKYYPPSNPAQLELHYIDATMMQFSMDSSQASDRWVNINSRPEDWYARQFAMHVKVAKRDNGKLGCARLVGADCVWDPVLSSQALKHTWAIEIDPQVAMDVMAALPKEQQQPMAEKQLKNGVLHEMMHALEVPHHADAKGEETEAGKVGGMPTCAMRQLRDDEYEGHSPVPLQTDLCRAGQTWKRFVLQTRPDGRMVKKTVVTPAHNCFGKIDLKSDP